MKVTVLDASSLLALFFDERGAATMEHLFQVAAEGDLPIFISAVNWAEVLYKMEQKRGKVGLETARQFGRTTPLEIVPVDCELAETTALLKNAHKLGLADAFAAALAKIKKAELITSDQEFRALAKEIKVVILK